MTSILLDEIQPQKKKSSIFRWCSVSTVPFYKSNNDQPLIIYYEPPAYSLLWELLKKRICSPLCGRPNLTPFFFFISPVPSTPGRCSIFCGLGFGKWLICRNVKAEELRTEDELWLETERGRNARDCLCSLLKLTSQTPTCQWSTFCSPALRVEVIVRNKTCLD